MASAKYEESVHYDGTAIARFYEDAHFYQVTDEVTGITNEIMGGGTSITGVLAKGQGLMLFPMMEMNKYLRNWARANTFEEILEAPNNWDDILKRARAEHTKKADRGKKVGTDAHAYVELYLRELLRVQGLTPTQATERPFKPPIMPEVVDISIALKEAYKRIYNGLKPKNFDDYKKLPRLIFQDAEIQEAIWIEATMLHKSTTAAKAWMDIHDIFVHGTEDTVYSRKYKICGRYDGDLSVTCTAKCGFCYCNGSRKKIAEELGLGTDAIGLGPEAWADLISQSDHKFTGRYMEDFKSTNASDDAPKGIYPEYLAQCGVYDLAKTEEFPEIVYDGYLILNGSKNEGTFNTHFSFDRDRNKRWALRLNAVKADVKRATKEVRSSA